MCVLWVRGGDAKEPLLPQGGYLQNLTPNATLVRAQSTGQAYWYFVGPPQSSAESLLLEALVYARCAHNPKH